MRFTLVVPLAPERQAPIIEDIKRLDYPKNEFHVVVAVGKNPSLNRNKGIDRAKGDFVVFLDDDAFINVNYLRKIDEFFERHSEVEIVGGPQLTPTDDSKFARVSGYALSSKFGAWKLSNRYTANEENLDVDETAVTTANLICRKEVVEKVRFDENLFPGEDPKFISDAKKNGFLVAYSPDIVVYHKRRAKFNYFVKQIFNYGKARPEKESFFETLKIPFFFIPSLFFIYVILLIWSIIINPSITGSVVGFNQRGLIANLEFLWMVPFLFYVLLTIIFSFHDSTKNNDLGSMLLLATLYPTIHLSYGAGMIYGYWRKLD